MPNQEPEFLRKPNPITEFIDEKEYDIVVIGAGSPGVPCALSAAEHGAHVALLQKEIAASACGNFAAGLDIEKSDPAEVQNLISDLVAASGHRAQREVIELWARESGEAFRWLAEKSDEAGCSYKQLGNEPQKTLYDKHNQKLEFLTLVYGPKPYNVGIAMTELAQLASKKGVDIFYSTPAEQLIQDESGAVVGVAAKTKDGYVKFLAKKGVVVATGDYQNDSDMVEYYLPDIKHFETKKYGRTGDGHKMLVWAGGKIENVTHTKMLHDFDSGHPGLMNAPTLRVNRAGRRIVNEEKVKMEYMNNYLFEKEDAGHYFEIFDGKVIKDAKLGDVNLPSYDEIKVYIADADVDERPNIVKPLINTFEAHSLEELAEKLGIDSKTFLATVKRYNELAEKGEDVDFGKSPQYLSKIENPPFIGVARHVRLTMACAGIEVNGEHQVLKSDHSGLIEGAYAIGNVSGRFYGSIDYPLDVLGLNLGHNFTEGYYLGKKLAQK
ncbi:MAG: FAD-binding protein [Coriobacteriia bacterium]|nr:FAD-binding protein [Coriobacteriia bacterium]